MHLKDRKIFNRSIHVHMYPHQYNTLFGWDIGWDIKYYRYFVLFQIIFQAKYKILNLICYIANLFSKIADLFSEMANLICETEKSGINSSLVPHTCLNNHVATWIVFKYHILYFE